MDPVTTKIVLGVIVLLLIVWDVVLWLDGVHSNTISEVIRKTAKRWLIIPFALGVLCGHWFWPL